MKIKYYLNTSTASYFILIAFSLLCFGLILGKEKVDPEVQNYFLMYEHDTGEDIGAEILLKDFEAFAKNNTYTSGETNLFEKIIFFTFVRIHWDNYYIFANNLRSQNAINSELVNKYEVDLNIIKKEKDSAKKQIQIDKISKSLLITKTDLKKSNSKIAKFTKRPKISILNYKFNTYIIYFYFFLIMSLFALAFCHKNNEPTTA